MKNDLLLPTSWLFLASCAPDRLPEYEAARAAALAAPPAITDNWQPDAALVLSNELLDRMIATAAATWGKLDQPVQLDGGIRVVPDLVVRSAKIAGSTSCTSCLAVDVTVAGEVTVEGPLTMTAPVQATASVDVQVEGRTDGGAHVITLAPRGVRGVAVRSDKLPNGVARLLDEPIRKEVEKRFVQAVKPSEVARFPSDGIPLMAVRPAPHRAGLRIDLRTAAATPTPLVESADKIREGWIFLVQQDTLLDLARAEAMRQGVVDYDIVPEPTRLAVGRGTFEMDLRLWKTTGAGWWRDYTVQGKLMRTADGFDLQASSVTERGVSEGATAADPLAELGRGVILDNIEASLTASLASKHAAAVQSGLTMKVEVVSVVGQGEAVRVAGDVFVVQPSGGQNR